MSSLLKRHRELIIVTALLLYAFGTFLASGGRPRQLNFFDRTVIAITAPVQSGLVWIFDQTGDGWSSYVALRKTHLRNEQLEAENQTLIRRVHELEEAKNENDRLRKLLAYSEVVSGHEVAARVIGINPVATFLSVRINRGLSDGVMPGMPVITPEGVVGRVQQSRSGQSDVMLIIDRNSRVAVRVQKSRARATTVGSGNNSPLKLENVLRMETLEDGDAIITSGTDGIYPAGLLVGNAVNVARKSSGMFLTAEVTPSVDVAKIDEVLVLTSGDLAQVPDANSGQGGVGATIQ